jgi:hypothetical protein
MPLPLPATLTEVQIHAVNYNSILTTSRALAVVVNKLCFGRACPMAR